MSFQPVGRPSVTVGLARWAVDIQPTAEDLALADRALLDTVAVGLAARTEPILRIAAVLPEEAQWAVACHIIDFDDLHLPSTTHVSTVCVPVSLSLGGGARSYLAGAGVMSRVGAALGWPRPVRSARRRGQPLPAGSMPTGSGAPWRSRSQRPVGYSAASVPTASRCRSASRCTRACGQRDWQPRARARTRMPWTT